MRFAQNDGTGPILQLMSRIYGRLRLNSLTLFTGSIEG